MSDTVFFALGCFGSVWLLLVAFIFRNFDIADILKKKGDKLKFYGLLAPSFKDMPENRRKANKGIRIYWISFVSLFGIVCAVNLILSLL